MPGGVTGAASARAADVTVVTAPLLPSSTGVDDDKTRRAARKDSKVSAILHTGYPVRQWDHDLGPDQPHLFDADGRRDLTAEPGVALRETSFDLSADGRFLVTSWRVPGRARRSGWCSCVSIGPPVSAPRSPRNPEWISNTLRSRRIAAPVAFTRETHSSPTSPPRITLCCMRFGEEPVELTADWDRWPSSVAWTADSTALVVTADDGGRGPIFSVDPVSGAVTRLTDDDFTYSDVRPAPGGMIYALRSSYAVPPHPVRIDPDGTVTELPCVAIMRSMLWGR